MKIKKFRKPSNRKYKPAGWRGESRRHSIASKKGWDKRDKKPKTKKQTVTHRMSSSGFDPRSKHAIAVDKGKQATEKTLHIDEWDDARNRSDLVGWDTLYPNKDKKPPKKKHDPPTKEDTPQKTEKEKTEEIILYGIKNSKGKPITLHTRGTLEERRNQERTVKEIINKSFHGGKDLTVTNIHFNKRLPRGAGGTHAISTVGRPWVDFDPRKHKTPTKVEHTPTVTIKRDSSYYTKHKGNVPIVTLHELSHNARFTRLPERYIKDKRRGILGRLDRDDEEARTELETGTRGDKKMLELQHSGGYYPEVKRPEELKDLPQHEANPKMRLIDKKTLIGSKTKILHNPDKKIVKKGKETILAPMLRNIPESSEYVDRTFKIDNQLIHSYNTKKIKASEVDKLNDGKADGDRIIEYKDGKSVVLQQGKQKKKSKQ